MKYLFSEREVSIFWNLSNLSSCIVVTLQKMFYRNRKQRFHTNSLFFTFDVMQHTIEPAYEYNICIHANHNQTSAAILAINSFTTLPKLYLSSNFLEIKLSIIQGEDTTADNASDPFFLLPRKILEERISCWAIWNVLFNHINCPCYFSKLNTEAS